MKTKIKAKVIWYDALKGIGMGLANGQQVFLNSNYDTTKNKFLGLKPNQTVVLTQVGLNQDLSLYAKSYHQLD